MQDCEQDMLGMVRCPLYCRSNCIIKHHPLLLAILNCVDTAQIKHMEFKLSVLENVINTYNQKQVWSPNDPVPDETVEYQFPMLHWVVTLGRVGAAVWLTGHNITDPRVKSSRHSGQTALHRALLSLQETCPHEAIKKFRQILSVLGVCLEIADDNGNTPLHICCERLGGMRPSTEYYKKCLEFMLQELADMYYSENTNKLYDVLNMQNSDGCIPLHYLAHDDVFYEDLTYLVELGADFTVKNKDGFSSHDLAVNSDAKNIQNLFETTEPPRHPPGHLDQCDTEYQMDDQEETNITSKNISNMETDSTNQVIEALISMETDAQDIHPIESQEPESHDQEIDQSDCSDCKNVTEELQESDDSASNVFLKAWQEKFKETIANFKDSSIKAVNKTEMDEVIVLFPDETDSSAQTFFEGALGYQKSVKKPVKSKTLCSQEEFEELVTRINAEESRLEFQEVLKHMDKHTVTEYLMTMKRDGKQYQPVIDFIMHTRNEALSKIQLADQCADVLHQKYTESEAKFDAMALDITESYNNLNTLNKEESRHQSSYDIMSQKSEAAHKYSDEIRERLDNCEAALRVMKKVYAKASLAAENS